jgi:hypothetical protein
MTAKSGWRVIRRTRRLAVCSTVGIAVILGIEFMFRYEDMVDKKFDALDAYLAFETEADGEVPSGTGKEKVVRKKAYGTGATGIPPKM